jgi:uncharacterized membrane protein YheB (UPF0754 family)
MMKILIPVIVGAIIGYATNWLAIKMLFKPHTEKRIFGIKVPFTPGLIPKEKSRIAKSVGETVGTHLLSPQTVADALSNKKISGQVKSWIEEKIVSLKNSNMLIKSIVKHMVGEHYEEFVDVLKKRATGFIIAKLRHPDFKDRLLIMIEKEFLDKYNDDAIEGIKDKVHQIIHNFSTSKQTSETIKYIIEEKFAGLKNDNRRLNEVIPEDLTNIIKNYLNNNDDKVVGFIKEMVTSQSFQTRISDSISEYLTQNSKGIMSMFIKADLVSGKIFDVIENYIASETNKPDIIMMITEIIEKLLQSRISEIVEGTSIEDKSYCLNFITDTAVSYITNKENQSKLISLAEQSIKDSKPYFKEKLLEVISQKIDILLESEGLRYYLSLIINDIFESISEKPLSFIFEDIENSTIQEISNLAKKIFDNIVTSKATNLIQLLNLSKLVENQINNFDVAFAEELIITIANKELRAITWVGAVLGAIIGGLTPFLQLLYG